MKKVVRLLWYSEAILECFVSLALTLIDYIIYGLGFKKASNFIDKLNENLLYNLWYIIAGPLGYSREDVESTLTKVYGNEGASIIMMFYDKA